MAGIFLVSLVFHAGRSIGQPPEGSWLHLAEISSQVYKARDDSWLGGGSSRCLPFGEGILRLALGGYRTLLSGFVVTGSAATDSVVTDSVVNSTSVGSCRSCLKCDKNKAIKIKILSLVCPLQYLLQAYLEGKQSVRSYPTRSGYEGK